MICKYHFFSHVFFSPAPGVDEFVEGWVLILIPSESQQFSECCPKCQEGCMKFPDRELGRAFS